MMKSKPKKKPATQQITQSFTGGKNKKGELIAGAVQSSSNFGGGSYSHGDEFGAFGQSNGASHISSVADDYGNEDFYDERQAIEHVSNVCAQAIAEARLKANMTQVDLAKKIGEKTSVVVDIENATATYSGAQISNIERALNCKIPRGRKKKRGGQKR